MPPLRDIRLVRFARRPLTWAVAATLLLGYVWAENLTPRAAFLFGTDAIAKRSNPEETDPTYWYELIHVADDGNRVIVRAHERKGDVNFMSVWDVRAGENVTPRHWQSNDWRGLICKSRYGLTSDFERMLEHPDGAEFLFDETRWDALRARFRKYKSQSTLEQSQVDRDESATQIDETLPRSSRMSTDGNYISFTARRGLPNFVRFDRDGDSTIIESTRNGERIATLPCVTESVAVAPGGHRAVSADRQDDVLRIWNLPEANCEATVLARTSIYEFNSAGDRLLTHSGGGWDAGHFQTWNSETAERVLDFYCFFNPCMVNDYSAVANVRLHVLQLQCLRTGQLLDEWDLYDDRRIVISGRHDQLIGNGRFFAIKCRDGMEMDFDRSTELVDRIARRIPNRPNQDEATFVVLDLPRRRVLGKIPGRSAAISREGGFIATLDAEGLVRVWELPLRRPWARGYLYAFAFVFGAWLAWRGVARCRANRRPSRIRDCS